jgi:hypothetical protein
MINKFYFSIKSKMTTLKYNISKYVQPKGKIPADEDILKTFMEKEHPNLTTHTLSFNLGKGKNRSEMVRNGEIILTPIKLLTELSDIVKTCEEKRQLKNEQNMNYYMDHREEINERRRLKYQQEHPKTKLPGTYYERNKDKIKKKAKIYREQQKVTTKEQLIAQIKKLQEDNPDLSITIDEETLRNGDIDTLKQAYEILQDAINGDDE